MVKTGFWRIVAGHPLPKSEVQAKSLHLGDWLRRGYVSIGFDARDQRNPSMKRFRDEMKTRDKLVVTTDGYLWAVGEVVGPMYTKSEPRLYPNRRDVVWYKVTRKQVRSFAPSLRNKLSQPHTVIPLEMEDWHSIVASI